MNHLFTYYIQYLTEMHFFLFFAILFNYVLFSFILNNANNTKFNKSLIKILTVIFIIFIAITIFMLLLSLNTTIYSDNLNDPVSATLNVNVTPSALVEISNAGTTAAGQLGLGTAIGGGMAASAKMIASSGLPPLQKLAILSAGGVVAGAIHTGFTSLNRSLAISQLKSFNLLSGIKGIKGSTGPSNNTQFPDLFVNSPFEFSILNFNWLPIDLSNPVLVVLFSIFILNLISFILLFLLAISLLARFFYNKDNKSLWVDSFFSHKFFGIKFKSFIKLLIRMYGKANFTNIVLIIFILIIALGASSYLLLKCLIHFPVLVKIYLDHF